MSIWTIADIFLWVAFAGALVIVAGKWLLIAAVTWWALYALVWSAIRLDTRRRT